MKKIVLVAALATLAACSKPDAAPVADTTEAAAAVAAPAAQTVAADGKPSVGTFQVTNAKGEVMTEEVKADGAYVQTKGGKVTETGKWEQKGPNLYCATEDKEGAKQKCYDEKVDDKGVYTSKHPETGEVSTVVRVEG